MQDVQVLPWYLRLEWISHTQHLNMPLQQGSRLISGFDEVRPTTGARGYGDRKSTRLNSSHLVISYAVFCLKKKKKKKLDSALDRHITPTLRASTLVPDTSG